MTPLLGTALVQAPLLPSLVALSVQTHPGFILFCVCVLPNCKQAVLFSVCVNVCVFVCVGVCECASVFLREGMREKDGDKYSVSFTSVAGWIPKQGLYVGLLTSPLIC